MKRVLRDQRLIRCLCVVAMFMTACWAGDLDLNKAILGKWKAGDATFEFLKDGSFVLSAPQGNSHGRYEVYGKDPTRVQQDEISVLFTDSSEALPLIGKISASGTEMTLTKSNGDAAKFTKVK